MIAKFIEMLTNNSLRIRSVRTIAEAETWIVKNGRVDHASGCHDDTLIALAMGVYVFENYLIKSENQKNKVKITLGLMARNWTETLRDNKTNPNNPQEFTGKRKAVGFFTSSTIKNKQPQRFYASTKPNGYDFYTYNPFLN